jgi:flavin-dependent dehydrogenase
MNSTYDVAIIGGGPAGSSAATYLARMGHSVAVFEKEKFPREHVGESLIPFCYYRLKDLGVIADIEKFATRKPGINFLTKDGSRESVWCFERVLKDGAGNIYHTPRAEFDKALLDNSAKAGAHVFEEHQVTETIFDEAGVLVSVKDKTAEKKQVRARFLLDASGQHSFLAKRNGVKKSYEGLDRVAFYRRWRNNTYDKALNAGMIKIVYLGGEKKGWFWVIPIGRNYLSIGVSLNHDYVREQKKKFTGADWKDQLYAQEIAEASCLDKILEKSVAEHETLSVSDYSYYATKKSGDSHALIGDAGAFLDPIFSSGLFAAMETAYRVTKAVDVQLRLGKEAGARAFEETFIDIEAGYKLIEKFVRLFYSPELLNFAYAGSHDAGYEKFLAAYNVFHYLLAGDFFTEHKKYTEFIDTLNSEKNYNRFLHYVRNKAQEFPDEAYCNYSFEEIYGHLPDVENLPRETASGNRSNTV